jgi:hypothetical protein
MGMMHWWNDIDRENSRYLEINLSHCHFLHQKTHVDWPENELGPPQREAMDRTKLLLNNHLIYI